MFKAPKTVFDQSPQAVFPGSAGSAGGAHVKLHVEGDIDELAR